MNDQTLLVSDYTLVNADPKALCTYECNFIIL